MDKTEAAACWEANAETWTRHVRAGYDVYRDALNTPAFLAMLPPVRGLYGLDIGCGEGANTRKLAELGARMRGVDVAATFVRHAREAEMARPLGVVYQVGDAAALPFADGSFDFVTAFMSLMDVAEQQQALSEACRVLKPGGFLQFSILHPCFVPPHRRTLRDDRGDAYAVEIAGYFDERAGRIEEWWFSTLPEEEKKRVPPFRVPRFHRTLSSWVDMICKAGFVIRRFGEPSASDAVAQ
ncbi:MAG: methyltransferase, partial [Rhizobiales bacterium 65-9]